MKTKVCTKCKKNKRLQNFYKRSARKSRSKYGKPYKKHSDNQEKEEYQQWCKDCFNQKCHNYYLKHKDKYKQRATNWKKLHREEHREQAKKERMRVVTFLGGKCSSPNCKWANDDDSYGCNDPRALQIDHINGDGYKYKNSYKSEIYYILKLIKENPDKVRKKFQLLCANCNWIKRAENHEY